MTLDSATGGGVCCLSYRTDQPERWQRMRRNPFPGLDPGATIRECLHYRRYGTWPASYLERMIRIFGGDLSSEDAELMADLGRTVVGDLKREARR